MLTDLKMVQFNIVCLFQERSYLKIYLEIKK